MKTLEALHHEGPIGFWQNLMVVEAVLLFAAFRVSGMDTYAALALDVAPPRVEEAEMNFYQCRTGA